MKTIYLVRFMKYTVGGVKARRYWLLLRPWAIPPIGCCVAQKAYVPNPMDRCWLLCWRQAKRLQRHCWVLHWIEQAFLQGCLTHCRRGYALWAGLLTQILLRSTLGV